MLPVISAVLWILTTIIVTYISVFLLFYYNFAPFKLSNRVKHNVNKDSIKLLFITLSGKIGVGSISGIAFSIIIGGKGTLLWIWLSSLIISIITFLEVKTGIKYRKKIKNYVVGGPLIYIKEEYKSKLISTIYIILIIISYLFAFILIQSNTILITINNNLLISNKLILIILIFLIIISTLNGIKTISKILTFLFPLMTIIYITIGLSVLVNNINLIPSIFKDILVESITIKSLLTIPFVIGFQRSIFSNEIGIGTTSMLVSMSQSNDYINESKIQLLGMYFISLIICTLSAFIIMTTDYNNLNITNFNGIEIINYAFSYHFGKEGLLLSTLIVSLFAFSTIITSYYYGNICLNYLFNIKSNKISKIIVIIVVLLSNYIDCLNVWAFVDIITAITTLINVYVLYKIRNKLKE